MYLPPISQFEATRLSATSPSKPSLDGWEATWQPDLECITKGAQQTCEWCSGSFSLCMPGLIINPAISLVTPAWGLAYAPYFVRHHRGKLADLVSLSHRPCPASVWRSQCKEGQRGREGKGTLDASVGSAHLSSTAEFLHKTTAATHSMHPPPSLEIWPSHGPTVIFNFTLTA